MRIDCCRNCGEKLQVLELCQVCKQPVRLQCGECLHFADDPIHSLCDLSKLVYAGIKDHTCVIPVRK